MSAKTARLNDAPLYFLNKRLAEAIHSQNETHIQHFQSLIKEQQQSTITAPPLQFYINSSIPESKTQKAAPLARSSANWLGAALNLIQCGALIGIINPLLYWPLALGFIALGGALLIGVGIHQCYRRYAIFEEKNTVNPHSQTTPGFALLS